MKFATVTALFLGSAMAATNMKAADAEMNMQKRQEDGAGATLGMSSNCTPSTLS